MSQHHVYGPVLSRRLGRSLGIDLLPFKTCSYDCPYCQLGRTTRHTTERREYVDVDSVLEEIRAHLKDAPDIISFAGSGEPTLHSGLGRCIAGIKALTDTPVAVFTNGSLLWQKEVRQALAQADIVSPSLDAALPETAEAVNRLAPGLDLTTILEGLQTFCAEFTGRIWLEILLVRGVNDSDRHLSAIDRVLRTLTGVEKIQLNTVCRPPADAGAEPLSRKELEDIARRICLPAEIIASFPENQVPAGSCRIPDAEEVYELVRCHPATAAGIASGLGVSREAAGKVAADLCAAGRLRREEASGETFFLACPGAD